ESVYLSIKEDETWNLKTDLDDPLLNNFECYQYTTYDLDIIRNIYILVNKINNKMIYAAESSRINIFSKYNNSYYIGAFINGDRTNPYFLYKE
ncbi:MAG TPA: hypothetical protein GXZ48_07225, partial [Acholeplasmataceae bacterium]|nr:hypothetical protein [Acholeplasmataceae bacterium]